MNKTESTNQKGSIVKSFWNEKWNLVITPFPTKTCHYFISNYGRIKSLNKNTGNEMLLKGSTMRGGYKTLNIRLSGKRRFGVYIHKFVAEHFIPKSDEQKEFVIHLDQSKENNHWQNLKWMTQQELTQWHINLGIFNPQNKKRGNNTKLTETKVKLIKNRISTGKTKKRIIAKDFGISMMQLNRIERGENWGYVTINGNGIQNE